MSKRCQEVYTVGMKRGFTSAVLGIVLGGFCGAHAAVLEVGPGCAFPTPSAAARAAQAGDVVEIRPGTYRGDVCRWRADRLTIRVRGGTGTAEIVADGRICEGKALWVVGGDDVRIEGVAFRGARCPDRNGAGIRLEGRNCELVRCTFTDNENGVLCGAIPGCRLRVADCVFRDNGAGDGQSHNAYIGKIDRLEFTRCRSDHARTGHALKSRALETVVADCVFDDGADGRSSYLVDLPNGGRATLARNRFRQSAVAPNGTMVAAGLEGAYPDSELTLRDNAFRDDRPNGRRLHAAPSVRVKWHIVL